MVKLTALDKATEWADASNQQTGEFSFMHGMRNDGPEGNQTAAEAMDKADEYVRSQFEIAKELLKKKRQNI